VDEEDFRFKKYSEPKQKKVGKPGWELKLLDQIRMFVLRDPFDFIVKNNLALELQLPLHQVGQCLTALIKEGLLVYKTVDPKNHESVSLGRIGTAHWHKGQWVWPFLVFTHKGFGNYKNRHSTRRDQRRYRSKRDVEKAKEKICPIKPEDWDGKAYHIVRGSEYVAACKAAGMPPDPESDWICPECDESRPHSYIKCENYRPIPCKYQRPHRLFWPLPVTVCKRCGSKISESIKHKENDCNTIIVRTIMQS
jgi:hypothetical protein